MFGTYKILILHITRNSILIDKFIDPQIMRRAPHKLGVVVVVVGDMTYMRTSRRAELRLQVL